MKEEDIVKMEAEDEPVFGISPSSLLQRQDKILTFISSFENSFDSDNLPWVIELVAHLHQKGIAPEEKKRFLTIFEKLESMRRGIMMKMAEMNKNEHQCKVCGDKFDTGRKLGGHMSRRHPGYSFEYFVKR